MAGRYSYFASLEMLKRGGEISVFERISRLSTRSDKPRIAFSGQFSAGKTTLINSMLGSPVLPTGLAEVTAIPTTVKHGPSERMFFLRDSSVWQQASDDEKEEILQLKASEMEQSALVKSYLEKIEEVSYEHPGAPGGFELLDLPGVSSGYQHLEDKVDRVLNESSGIVWVVNAAQGGISTVDVDYLRHKVPEETPVLVVLTHTDLVDPRGRKEVLETTKKNLVESGLKKVIEVIERGKGDNLLDNRWFTKLVNKAERNDRLRPAITQGIDLIESETDKIKREIQQKLRQTLEGAGLSKKELRRFVKKLVNTYKKAVVEGLNPCVSSPHVVGGSLDKDCLRQWRDTWFDEMGKVLSSQGKHVDAKMANLELWGEQDVAIYMWWPLWGEAYNRMIERLFGCYQALWTACWRFEVSPDDTNIGQAFKEYWKWGVIEDYAIETAEKAYDDHLKTLEHILLLQHPLVHIGSALKGLGDLIAQKR